MKTPNVFHKQPPTLGHQRGVVLLESLIAILLFSIGILGLVGLQAASIKNINEANYRTEASLLAASLYSTIWTDGDARTKADVESRYTGGGGTDGVGYTAWYDRAKTSARLPGFETLPPEVKVEAGGNTSSAKVSITIYWVAPGDSAVKSEAHRYNSVTEIGKNLI